MPPAIVFRSRITNRNYAAVLESDLTAQIKVVDSLAHLEIVDVSNETVGDVDPVLAVTNALNEAKGLAGINDHTRTKLDSAVVDFVDISTEEIWAINMESQYSACVKQAIEKTGLKLSIF